MKWRRRRLEGGGQSVLAGVVVVGRRVGAFVGRLDVVEVGRRRRRWGEAGRGGSRERGCGRWILPREGRYGVAAQMRSGGDGDEDSGRWRVCGDGEGRIGRSWKVAEEVGEGDRVGGVREGWKRTVTPGRPGWWGGHGRIQEEKRTVPARRTGGGARKQKGRDGGMGE